MLLAIRLKRIRLREQKKLSEKNLWLFKNITAYIKNSILTSREGEEVLQQIMDMILQAQKENKSVDLFIGNDYEVFCKSIIDEYNNSKSILYRVLNILQRYLVAATAAVIIIGFSNYLNGNMPWPGIKTEQTLIACEIALICILALHLSLQEKVGLVPAYLPFYKRIKYNYLNQKDIAAPAIGFVIFTPFINILIKRLMGEGFMNYQVMFYNNIQYFILIILGISLIQVYKTIQNRK